MFLETYINRIAHLAARGKYLDTLVFGNMTISLGAGFLLIGLTACVSEPYRDIVNMLSSGIYLGFFLSFFLFWILLIPLALTFLFFLYGPNLMPIDRALVHSWLLAPIPLVPFVAAWSVLFMILSARDPACEILAPPGGPAWIHWPLVDVGVVMTPVLGLIIAIRIARSVNQRITDIIGEETEPCCPRCGYPLVGLPKPICPECGHEVQDDEPDGRSPSPDSQ